METAKEATLSLAPYTGPWDVHTAAHLLRRTTLGPTLAEIRLAHSQGLTATLDHLLNSPTMALSDPINYSNENDENVPVGASWVGALWSSGMDFARRNSFRGWRVDNLLRHNGTLHEKMRLFWFNHFAVESNVVADARGSHELSMLFYHQGLGNFRSLVEQVTVSQAMLIYLNGNTNQASSPNENYARELLELFTVGKGPLVGNGDYTYYTEGDIQEAARVLSGFTTKKNPLNEVVYVSNRHDKDSKTFSQVFGNQTITNQEDQEYKALIDMIFRSQAAPYHLCRKLYRWFVYYDITPEVEENIIGPMATLLRESDFEVLPVLRLLLGSEHFYGSHFRGALIKSPVDHTLGFLRQLEVAFPGAQDFNAQYLMWLWVHNSLDRQLQNLSDPPDVAGWKAYYQEPGFHRLWVSSVTLQERNTFTDRMLDRGYTREGLTIKVDPFAVFDQFDGKDDPNEVVRQFAELLLPLPISEQLAADLKETLIPGLPDFEWTVEYNAYLSAPGNETIKRGIADKLKALVYAIKSLPHYHLS